MKKEILKLGKTLSKVEQKQINGGINLTNFSSIGCFNLSGGGAPGGSPGHYSNGSDGAPGMGNGDRVCTWQHNSSNHRVTVPASWKQC